MEHGGSDNLFTARQVEWKLNLTGFNCRITIPANSFGVWSSIIRGVCESRVTLSKLRATCFHAPRTIRGSNNETGSGRKEDTVRGTRSDGSLKRSTLSHFSLVTTHTQWQGSCLTAIQFQLPNVLLTIELLYSSFSLPLGSTSVERP